MAFEQRLLAFERVVLPNDDTPDPIEQNRAAAHRTRRQRRVERRLAVYRRRLAAGILERVHLSVQHRAAVLYSAVVSPSDDLALRHDHRSDWDATFAETQLRLGDGRRQKWIAGHAVAARIASYSKTFGPRGASWAIVVIALARVRARRGAPRAH